MELLQGSRDNLAPCVGRRALARCRRVLDGVGLFGPCGLTRFAVGWAMVHDEKIPVGLEGTAFLRRGGHAGAGVILPGLLERRGLGTRRRGGFLWERRRRSAAPLPRRFDAPGSLLPFCPL